MGVTLYTYDLLLFTGAIILPVHAIEILCPLVFPIYSIILINISSIYI